jgi:predicted lipoprotein with Yx(FWY)xxD motif
MISSAVRLLSAVLVLAAIVPVTALANPIATAKPAIEMKSNLSGKKVIATSARLGIYFWDVEKKAGGKVRCKGSCLTAWPAVYVKGPVAKHVKGVMATFGTVKRGKRLQLTVNGLPAYTYHGDTAGVVKCDNVDGWHAVRAGG